MREVLATGVTTFFCVLGGVFILNATNPNVKITNKYLPSMTQRVGEYKDSIVHREDGRRGTPVVNVPDVKRDYVERKKRIKPLRENGRLEDAISRVSERTGEFSSGFVKLVRRMWNEEMPKFEPRQSSVRSIEEEHREILSKKKGMDYNTQYALEAQKLVDMGYFTSVGQVAYAERVLYFETLLTGFKLEQAIEVANVFKNRYNFDKKVIAQGEEPVFNVKGGNMFTLIFKKDPNQWGGITHQFDCIRNFPDYFDGTYDIYDKHKRLSLVGNGEMNSAKAQAVHQALYGVLTDKYKDNTGGALFYQNPKVVKKMYDRGKTSKGSLLSSWVASGMKVTSPHKFRKTNPKWLMENYNNHVYLR